MEKSRKQKLKEKRTLMHVINTCLKHGIGFEKYSNDGSLYVNDFVGDNFRFRKEFNPKWGKTIFELRDELDVYIKHHKKK